MLQHNSTTHSDQHTTQSQKNTPDYTPNEPPELAQFKSTPIQKEGSLNAAAAQSPSANQSSVFQMMASQGPQAKKAAQFKKMAESKDSPSLKQSNTEGLPTQLKTGIENLSGMDMSDVKVHYNSIQPTQLKAHAFAQGSEIHLASGQEKHLSHEAWHVVQQKQGRVQPTTQFKRTGVAVNDDPILEKEADKMGAEALRSENQSSSPTQLTASPEIATPGTFQLMREFPKMRGGGGGRRVEDMSIGELVHLMSDPHTSDGISLAAESELSRRTPSSKGVHSEDAAAVKEAPSAEKKEVEKHEEIEEPDTETFSKRSKAIAISRLLSPTPADFPIGEGPSVYRKGEGPDGPLMSVPEITPRPRRKKKRKKLSKEERRIQTIKISLLSHIENALSISDDFILKGLAPSKSASLRAKSELVLAKQKIRRVQTLPEVQQYGRIISLRSIQYARSLSSAGKQDKGNQILQSADTLHDHLELPKLTFVPEVDPDVKIKDRVGAVLDGVGVTSDTTIGGLGGGAAGIADFVSGLGSWSFGLGIGGGVFGAFFGLIALITGIWSAVKATGTLDALVKDGLLSEGKELRDISEYAASQARLKKKRAGGVIAVGTAGLIAGGIGITATLLGIGTLGLGAALLGIIAALGGLGMVAWKYHNREKKRTVERRIIAKEKVDQLLARPERLDEINEIFPEFQVTKAKKFFPGLRKSIHDKVNPRFQVTPTDLVYAGLSDERRIDLINRITPEVATIAKSKRQKMAEELIDQMVNGKPSVAAVAEQILEAIGSSPTDVKILLIEQKYVTAINGVMDKLESW